MLQAKEVSVKNVVLVLAFSMVLSAGYFVTRPRVAASSSVPIFMGEEVVVPKAATVTKAVSVPIPAPVSPAAAPLPLVPPSVTLKVLPVYPASALAKEITGTVLLAVYVELNGQPEKIETKTSSGIADLDSSAVKAVSQWRFNPAAQAGAALASWYEVPVRFAVK